MSSPSRTSPEAGETRADSPTSTTSNLTELADEVHDNKSSSTPPTSVGDFADISSQIGKQESPELTMSDQAANNAEGGATRAMPPPATPATPVTAPRRSERARENPNYNIDATIRASSGHKKRGPRSNNEVFKEEVDAIAARRQSMSYIPAFVNNNHGDTVIGNTLAQASASRHPKTPDNNGNGVSDVEMLAQGSHQGQSDSAAHGSTAKRACRTIRDGDKARVEAERLKAKEAKLQAKLDKANQEVLKIQLELNRIQSGETPAQTAAPSPSPAKLKREVKRLEDTKEYKKHEEGVVIVEEIWSKGKKVVPGQPQAVKKTKKETTEEVEAPDIAPMIKEVIKQNFTYKNAGLFAGSEYVDPFWTPKDRKEAQRSGFKARKILPLPMGPVGKDMLSKGSDFVLPFAVCSPIVGRGHEKPPKHGELSKNRFVGDAANLWERSKKGNESSPCQCNPEDACGENCTNFIMNYDCSDDNCPIGKELCTNRQFDDLANRTAKGGPFNIGVNVVRTGATGFGVRASRGFRAGQIIVEYCGEVITADECERRMHEVYKDQPCYYLMSFDQKMIIDAGQKGSIARFVNHSCSPNCEMKKIFVNGEPRMALFAVKEVTTGQELTYDYNFHTFSDLSKQVCHCGANNCRGFLMPKTNSDKRKDSQTLAGGVSQAVRGAAQAVAKTAKGAANGLRTAGKDLKRKLISAVEEDDETDSTAVSKKRKTAVSKSPAKRAPLGAAANKGKEIFGSMTLGATSKNAPAAPKLTCPSFLDGTKTNGSTDGKKQTKLSFFSSSAVSSSVPQSKASLAPAPPADAEEDSEMKDAQSSASESESSDSEMEEDDLESFDIAHMVNTIISIAPKQRTALPSAAPVSAQGKGGNRLRLVFNPSPGSSKPVSGQSSRDASPGPPIVSALEELAASKKPRFRAKLNKTTQVLPPAPTPGGPPVPKRPRKRKSTRKAKVAKAATA